METQAPHWRQLAFPAAFALTCVALMIATWIAFGGSLPFSASGYRFMLPLPQATAIYPGTSVRIAGVNVGKVIAVAREGGRANVQIQLQPQFSPLHTGATAIMRTKTLLGEGYIAMAPGPQSAPALPDGGTLKSSQVMPTQPLNDVLATFAPQTRANIQALFAGLTAALAGRSQQLNQSIGYAAPTTGNLTTVAETLDQQRAALGQLISSAGDIVSSLGAREGAMQSAIDAGNLVLETTAERSRALAATVDALPAFLVELRSASNTLGAASGDLGSAAHVLGTVTPGLAPALTEITRAGPSFRTLFRQLPATLKAGDRGLPALTQILKTADPALAPIYTAARQLIPLLQLTGVSSSSIIGSLANVGQVLNGVMIGPGGQRIHYGVGLPTIWNEILAGWIKKLPTNRANPYPEPSAKLDIARGGLRAYDCRNINNPLYLPPTGTGAPPCLTQGPWAFNGVTQSFPHLTEAGP